MRGASACCPDQLVDLIQRTLDLVVTFSQLVSRAEALKHLVERILDLVSQVAHMIQLRSRP